MKLFAMNRSRYYVTDSCYFSCNDSANTSNCNCINKRQLLELGHIITEYHSIVIRDMHFGNVYIINLLYNKKV